jgi:hypothetical protein
VASGKIEINTRRYPYVANFKIVPANIILPANGASTCALINQVFKGQIGVLIAKAKKKAQD